MDTWQIVLLAVVVLAAIAAVVGAVKARAARIEAEREALRQEVLAEARRNQEADRQREIRRKLQARTQRPPMPDPPKGTSQPLRGVPASPAAWANPDRHAPRPKQKRLNPPETGGSIAAWLATGDTPDSGVSGHHSSAPDPSPAPASDPGPSGGGYDGGGGGGAVSGSD